MIAPPTDHLRLIRCAREYPRRPGVWADAFRAVDWNEAECLSEKPRGAVWRVDLDLPDGPEPVVIKVHAHSSPVKAARSILHGGRLRRHWRGAAKLSRHGFGVAKCRALLRGMTAGRLIDVLVMERVEGRTLIELLADPTLNAAREHALADGLGELISTLDRHRLHSKDLKPSNILVTDDDELVIIDSDTVGHRPAHPLLPLALEPLGLGLMPRRALAARVIRSWAWHEWLNGPTDRPELAGVSEQERIIARLGWKDLERLIARHGDPRPVHNPLAAFAPEQTAEQATEQSGRPADESSRAVALRAASG